MSQPTICNSCYGEYNGILFSDLNIAKGKKYCWMCDTENIIVFEIPVKSFTIGRMLSLIKLQKDHIDHLSR